MSREDEIKAMSDERLKEIQERDEFARKMNALAPPTHPELSAAFNDRSELLHEVSRLRRENEELRKGKTPLCEKCKGFGVINKTEMHGKGPAQSLHVVQIPCPNGCEKSIALYAHKETP